MADRALTKLQIDTLKLVRSGAVSYRRHGYAAWRIIGGNPTVVGKLSTMGLVCQGKSDGSVAIFEITDEGKARLGFVEFQ